MSSTHGPVQILSILDREGTWTHVVPSHSHPGTEHIVTVTPGRFPIHGECHCPARKPCWHMRAAIEAETYLRDCLYTIRKCTALTASGDDWAYAAQLLARITYPLPASAGTMEVAA